MNTDRTYRQRQPIHHDVADVDDLYSVRLPSSARRYRSYNTSDDPSIEDGSSIRRASRSEQQTTSGGFGRPSEGASSIRKREPAQVPGRRLPAAMLILGAVMAVILIMLASALLSWWRGVLDDVHYGYPRTSHLDAVVGHNDSVTNQTHFIFLNLHGRIEIIEIPGGDISRTRTFAGPTLVGSGQDLVPVTGEIRDRDGRRDLIVHIQNQQIVFINDGVTFHQE
jgi:hypothetical protein